MRFVHNSARARARRISVGLAVLAIVVSAAPVSAAPDGASSGRQTHSSKAVHHDTSAPLRDIAPATLIDRFSKKHRDLGSIPYASDPYVADGVAQTVEGTAAAAPLSTSFDGLGVGFSGPQGTYTVRWAPPDTAGAVGRSHYVEIVNTDFAIFDKTGAVVYGPAATNTLFTGFGGACQARNDGDGTVEYDSLADRWVISQFALGGPPYYQCVAVSTSSDPTGSYYRYAFSYNDFPDYPKLGVWPDAYYTTFNLFQNTFAGALVCAYDRAAMLNGAAARQQCVNLGTAYSSLLPADLDGPTSPPAGAPGYLVSMGSNRLNLWRFDVDWAAPSASRLSGPTAVSVASFSGACGGGTCIPQPGTNQQLGSLGDRLMYRLAYRNFGDHDALVVNHSIRTGTFGTGPSGVRWYELRNPAGTPVVHQQGTFAPDSTYRWMGSAAMDGAGNLAIGYSASSSSVKPGLRYAGRLVSDPLGTLGQGEGIIMNGGGVQLPQLARWGDYTALSVDPVDDCTFWYVGQYLKADGTWNWSTRIASWRFPNCAPATPDYGLAVNPVSRTVSQAGGSTGYSVTVSPSGGFAADVALSVSDLPAGAGGSFSPTSASAGSGWASTLTVSVPAGTTPATYPLTITGTGGGVTHTTTASLVVEPPSAADFSLSLAPTSRTVRPGATTTFTVGINRTGGFTGSVDLAVSGLPAGYTSSFSQNPAAPATSQVILTVTANSTRGTFGFTVTGTSGALTHSVNGQIKVNGK